MGGIVDEKKESREKMGTRVCSEPRMNPLLGDRRGAQH